MMKLDFNFIVYDMYIPYFSAHSPTFNCTSPFQTYHSTCVTHISKTHFAFYGDIQNGCSRIGGELFKIQPSLPWKEELIRQYSSGKFGLTLCTIFPYRKVNETLFKVIMCVSSAVSWFCTCT